MSEDMVYFGLYHQHKMDSSVNNQSTTYEISYTLFNKYDNQLLICMIDCFVLRNVRIQYMYYKLLLFRTSFLSLLD